MLVTNMLFDVQSIVDFESAISPRALEHDALSGVKTKVENGQFRIQKGAFEAAKDRKVTMFVDNIV
jgi:hypothetical protein